MTDAPDLTEQAIADLLGAHADCIMNCDIKTDGVRDGRMWYLIHWTCGMTSGPVTLSPTSLRDDHRAHVAALLAERVRGARAEALREAVDAIDKERTSEEVRLDWPKNNPAGLVSNYIGGFREAAKVVRARADHEGGGA